VVQVPGELGHQAIYDVAATLAVIRINGKGIDGAEQWPDHGVLGFEGLDQCHLARKALYLGQQHRPQEVVFSLMVDDQELLDCSHPRAPRSRVPALGSRRPATRATWARSRRRAAWKVSITLMSSL
jgi:hypothetical protein